MMEREILGLVVAIFLGTLIGLQREFKQQHLNVKNFAGFRSFILVAFFGGILGYLTGSFESVWVILGFVIVAIFSISAYYVVYKKTKKISGTTELAFILTYILGVMSTTGNSELAVIFGIIITTFLTFKERLHTLAKKLEPKELMGMVKFGLIAFVILPFLPNKNYSPLDIPGFSNVLQGLNISVDFVSKLDVFNFHTIWLMVIFIAGINLIGYFLVKIIGSKKGYGILGFVGGMISSTAVMLAMAGECKGNKKNLNPFLLAVIISTSVMFLRVIFEVAVVNPNLLVYVILPLFGMFVFGMFFSFIFYKKNNDQSKSEEEIKLKQPFALIPALKFGGIFMSILIISRIAQLLFGKIGLYATSVLSGITNVDAVTLTMASLSKSGEISLTVAAMSIFIAIASNTFIKSGIAYFMGNKKFGMKVFFVFSLILLLGLTIVLLI